MHARHRPAQRRDRAHRPNPGKSDEPAGPLGSRSPRYGPGLAAHCGRRRTAACSSPRLPGGPERLTGRMESRDRSSSPALRPGRFLVETYAAAQEVAAAVDAVQGDRTRVPFDGTPASTSELSALRNVDSHAVSRAARMIAVTAPWSQVAITARQTHGPTIAQLTTSRRLRQRCRHPRDRSSRQRSRKSSSRTSKATEPRQPLS